MVKVRVLGHPFRDSTAKNMKRRPGNVFQATRKRADFLIKEGFVEEINPKKKELKTPRETKEEKIQGETK